MKQDLRKTTMTRVAAVLALLCISGLMHAQGIKGKIVDVNGDPLPFAAIFVVGTDQGIASNIEGDYLLPLYPGKYKVRFQYLGYTPFDTTFQVGETVINYKAVMKPEVVALPEAIVSGNGEDPAYTIMRRAIAKAKYHSMQVDEYHAMVYVKGSGRLTKVPGLFRKQINKALAEEGIDSTVAFTQESVSKLHYTRPDQYRDTVISIRTSGDDNNTSPMSFIYSSFYEPKVVGGVSPLAPDAFGHYRFEYLGYIQDGQHTINKIKVTPRGRGDNVYEGVIYIVDNVWSIHSLDLTTYVWGIKFDIQQQFEPYLSDVWLPNHEIYDVSGSVFGFGFEYRYFAKLKDYEIKLNPDLEVPVVVLDAKVETEEAKAAEQKRKNESFDTGLTQLDPNEELSVKQLRKMMKEYEKQEIEALPDADTVEYVNTSSQVIDSSAYKQDSTYWEEVRPMPLTNYEVKGYARMDSIAAIPPSPDEDKMDEDQDSVTITMGDDGLVANVKRRSEFKFSHLITGGRYTVGEKHFLQMKAILQTINFNTVDGFHFGYSFDYGNAGKKPVNYEIGAFGRYAFSREAFNYEGRLKLFGKGWSLLMQGGNQTMQFADDHRIAPWANSIYTLFFNRNYMKIYEQKFGRITYVQKVSEAFGFDMSAEYADRTHLENTTDFIVIDGKKRLYTDNDPVHIAGDDQVFNDHEAIITDVTAWIKPFWEYRVQRGAKIKDFSRSPKLALRYKKGWGEDYDPFDLVTAQVDAKMNIGAGSLLSMRIAAGTFLGEKGPRYFADFAHYPGSQMIGSPVNPVSAFRMLDYYLYSTDDQFAYGLFNYQFRRFALTQIENFRRDGIRENVIFNTLLSPESDQYAEIGYGINYLFRFARIEFVSSWQDYKYKDFAIRIGIATDFESLFGGF
jgi:hypothetical protein